MNINEMSDEDAAVIQRALTFTELVAAEQADLRQRIAELERHNKLLRAVAVSLDSYFSCDINNSNLMDNLQGKLEKALLSAIDGGALDATQSPD